MIFFKILINGSRNSNDSKVAKIPSQLIVDPHEWRNDFPTVSKIVLVKLNFA